MKKNNKHGYDKRTSNFEKKQVEKNEGEKVVVFKGSKSVQELAKDLGISATDVIKFLFMEGKMVTINSDLDVSLAELVCLNYGYDIKIEKAPSDLTLECSSFVAGKNSRLSGRCVWISLWWMLRSFLTCSLGMK